MSNWTGTDGIDPRPYATRIRYYCRREGWGYPSSGDNDFNITCQWDGQWNQTSQQLPKCIWVACINPPIPDDSTNLIRNYTELSLIQGLNSIHFRVLTKIFTENFTKIFTKKLSKFILKNFKNLKGMRSWYMSPFQIRVS